MGIAKSSGVEEQLSEVDSPGRLVVDLDTDWLWSDTPTEAVPGAEAAIAALTEAYNAWLRELHAAGTVPLADAAAPMRTPTPSGSSALACSDADAAAERWRRDRERLQRAFDATAHPATVAFSAQVRQIWLDHVLCYLLKDYRAFIRPDTSFDTAAFVASFPEHEQAFVQVRSLPALARWPCWGCS